MKDELLPCPFCGSNVEIVEAKEAGPQAYCVCCTGCQSSSAVVYALKGPVTRELTDRWNRRSPAEPVAWRDVVAERARQIEKEGWTLEHDDAHNTGEMAAAAACYALQASAPMAENIFWKDKREIEAHELWPWDREWWKPSDPRRMLVKAAALLLAEIERLDRSTLLPPVAAAEGEFPNGGFWCKTCKRQVSDLKEMSWGMSDYRALHLPCKTMMCADDLPPPVVAAEGVKDDPPAPWDGYSDDQECRKCNSESVYYRRVEASDGGHTDYQYQCATCNHQWWIDGIDS